MRASVLRRLLLGGGLALILLLAWTALALLSVRDDLAAARETLDRVRQDRGGVAVSTQLRLAERRLDRAAGRLRAPGPALTAQLPVIGRTPEAVRRTADATLSSVRAAQRLLDAVEARPLLQDGAVDLERLAVVRDAARSAGRTTAPEIARLRDLDLGLVPPLVRDPVREAQAELGELPGDLVAAADGLSGLSGLLGAEDPRRLLLVIQNNAELRGTGGLVSVFAEATAVDGRLVLGAFRDVEEVADPPERAVAVPAPDDYADVFGPLLAATTLWKNANADPDVPRSSTVLAGVAGATLGYVPDGIVWLDVPALAAVLRATSPAVLPDGTELTGDNAVEVLLSAAYEEVDDTTASQALRRARLRAAADAIAARVLGGAPDASQLADELGAAARGRHLSVWSRDGDEQRALLAAGLAGAVAAAGGDLQAFTVHNLGAGGDAGNKLDYYAQRSVRVDVQVGRGAVVVEREVVLRNDAPLEGLPGYVAGEQAPGVTSNLVLHSLPAGAEIEEYRRGEALLDARPQALGDTVVVTDVVRLAPGTSVSWRLRYRLPVDGTYALRVVPQPLARPGRLDVTIRAEDGVELSTAPGGVLQPGSNGVLQLSTTLEPELAVDVDIGGPGLLRRAVDAVVRFWREPVPAPW